MFICCGVKYSKNDPNTFWCIESALISPCTKKNVGNSPVKKEVVDILHCKKNDCSKIKIFRYGKPNKDYILLETEELSGKKARQFLEKTAKYRTILPSQYPCKFVKSQKFIPMSYGYATDKEHLRMRYLSEDGYSSETIYSPLKITKLWQEFEISQKNYMSFT